jgi:carboxyl-terminal processing protease
VQEEIISKKIRPAKNKIAIFIFILLLIAGAFFIGFSIGENSSVEKNITGVVNRDLNKPEDVDFMTFWKAWNVINEKYVDNDEVVPQNKIWGAIEGLADSLGDPYTVFLPPQESELFAENIRGNFGGVGMEVGMRDGILTVIAPLKNTPAEKAGVLAGDQVIAVDGKSTADLGIDEAVSLIRGEIGTSVKLTIFREGSDGTLDIDVVRGNIKIPTSESILRDDGIFVISLFNFSAISPDEFRDGLRAFLNSGSDKLILDLRGNPGGFLNAATDMASWFLPVGKVIVTENYGKNGEDIVHRSKGYNIFKNNLKFVILVNQGSASASEILAGALQEHGKATLVGAQTFGKGSVQELVNITDETSLKVTVAKWLTPNGNSISDGGVTPDIEVEITMEDIEAGRDPQMEKAVEILLN